jgi:Xaa-Pro dipeptidase
MDQAKIQIVSGTYEAHEEMERACRALEAAGIHLALLTSSENVTYVSGYEVPIHVGPPAAFSGMNPLVLALLSVKDRQLRLIAVDFYESGALRAVGADRLTTFSAFGHFDKVDPEQSYVGAIGELLAEAGLGTGSRARLGVEKASLPAVIQEMIACRFAHVELTETAGCFMQARWIKTDREIGLLREAARILDSGQRRFVELAVSFAEPTSELELWRDIETAMNREAGKRMTVTGELLTGPRIARIAPGGPVARQVKTGEAGLMDVSPRVNGYWADSSNVAVFGVEPSPEQRRYFIATREAFEAAYEVLRPGTRCCDVEAAIRRTLSRHGFPVAHYSGHQIGVSVNEWPKLVPYDTSVIESGMVFAVEPGVYEGEGGSHGSRAERMVLITDDGPELLNHFPWGI